MSSLHYLDLSESNYTTIITGEMSGTSRLSVGSSWAHRMHSYYASLLLGHTAATALISCGPSGHRQCSQLQDTANR